MACEPNALVLQTVIDVPWEKDFSHSHQHAYAFYLVVTKKLFPCLMFVFRGQTQTKGRAMSGNAAKIVFARDNVQHFGRAL